MTSPPAAHRKKVSKRRAESGPQHPLPPSLPHRIIPLRQTQPGLKPKPARNFRKTGERTGRADPVWTGLSKASAARRNWADRRKASAARPGSFCAVRTASVISSGRRMPQPSGRLPGSAPPLKTKPSSMPRRPKSRLLPRRTRKFMDWKLRIRPRWTRHSPSR